MQQPQGTYVSLSLLAESSKRYWLRAASVWAGDDNIRPQLRSPMAALTYGNCDSPPGKPYRGRLLRMLDTLAEWQMRHSHRVISRAQTDNATMTGVTQPSSGNERSSTSPCDR